MAGDALKRFKGYRQHPKDGNPEFHDLTGIYEDLIDVVKNTAPAASPVSDAVELTAVILELEQAHTLLAKSELAREEYQKISPLLASSKLRLFSICNKSTPPTPTNVQEQGQDELWEDFFITWSEVYHESPTVAREQSIKEMQSKYTITKKQ